MIAEYDMFSQSDCWNAIQSAQKHDTPSNGVFSSGNFRVTFGPFKLSADKFADVKVRYTG